ncbi:unnamed protein product [Lasius platythorax]|uniref:Uncharacterized protein n=1 Tax=Lasius platythorax TaxID=488582 RepID=A0AAV2NUP5_9HYME
MQRGPANPTASSREVVINEPARPAIRNPTAFLCVVFGRRDVARIRPTNDDGQYGGIARAKSNISKIHSNERPPASTRFSLPEPHAHNCITRGDRMLRRMLERPNDGSSDRLNISRNRHFIVIGNGIEQLSRRAIKHDGRSPISLSRIPFRLSFVLTKNAASWIAHADLLGRPHYCGPRTASPSLLRLE